VLIRNHNELDMPAVSNAPEPTRAKVLRAVRLNIALVGGCLTLLTAGIGGLVGVDRYFSRYENKIDGYQAKIDGLLTTTGKTQTDLQTGMVSVDGRLNGLHEDIAVLNSQVRFLYERAKQESASVPPPAGRSK
jgi:hypothetical protein